MKHRNRNEATNKDNWFDDGKCERLHGRVFEGRSLNGLEGVIIVKQVLCDSGDGDT